MLTTLTDIIRDKAHLQHSGVTFIEGGDKEEFMAYSELYQAALLALSVLQEDGMQPGDELVFQLNDNKSFVIAFWACILGGIIPVPLSVGLNEGHVLKVFNVWKVLRAPRLITSGGVYTRIRSLSEK